jgi:hypothetical protein
MPREETMQCAFCGKETELQDPVSRSDTCIHCGRDIRCCRNCTFYDPSAYNECREVSADRVLDKERANFCDYFTPVGTPKVPRHPAKDARAALEALFKKS